MGAGETTPPRANTAVYTDTAEECAKRKRRGAAGEQCREGAVDADSRKNPEEAAGLDVPVCAEENS